ncbi:TPA: hypothetical protein PVM56_000013 [Staphylococcus aureus]|nr:hypothetical protein [Staphylococcus aureus]
MHNEKLIKGLYDYREEHDACGIGFYANMDNKRSHDIIDKSLEMLRRLDHRGGVGADGITGDGAGIMTEIPFAFFKQHVTDFDIPGEGEYAVGLFFSKERILGSEHEVVFKKYFEGEGLSILGYRNVPVNKDAIAKHVADTMPVIQQVFIDIRDIEDVEKRLFLARKQLEFYSTQCDLELYFTSLSRKTIVYKGWLRSDQIKKLYTDLSDDLYQSKLGLVHSRFSTNTFPSWKRAHPNRMLMHNGEINTIKGNVNWMRARQHKLIETLFGEDQHKVFQIVDEDGSDSAIVDNALEFLSLAMEPEKAAMLLIPEPWLYNEANDANVRAFYEFYSYLMEPWDGPTMISFCNGDKLGALTDRNGLRPGRYTITKDNFIVFSSEVGVVDVPESNVAFKGQLNPGKLLLVDFKQNKVIENNDLKGAIAGELPYKAWIDNHKVDFDFENIQYQDSQWKDETLFKLQRQFAYTKEEIHKYIQELVEGKKDPIGAMGYDAPIAVLNERPESLFNYFKQLFAQVTNPPIDAYREKIVTSELSYLGGEGNLLAPDETVLDRIQLKRPVLNESHIAAIDQEHFKLTYLSTVYEGDLEDALEALGREAVNAVKQGAQILVLDDSGLVDSNGFAMPMLLAISHVHQLLIKADLRMSTSLVAKSGETREVHHVACLLAYGANAIVPYLAQRTVEQLTLTEGLQGTVVDNVKTYTDVLSEGVIKVMAKMGISTVQSYQGAQIFEAIGLSHDVIDRYFTGTQSKLSGISIDQIDAENKARQQSDDNYLASGSTFQWRQQGQHHAFNPESIFLLQHACKENDYAQFKAYSEAVNKNRTDHIRHLLEFKACTPIDIDQVEPVSDIVKRFNTGAMSYGSISAEAHETLAQAMNQLGGKSNSGEGGEDAKRYEVQVDGSNKVSAIKQVASGRFGVTSDYLQHAKEIQIKVAQGAKPGKDVAYACALGAEEFGFATAPLVVLGCIMMRVCHKDTCPVGVATQNKDLRALYRGKAHHVVNFMHFIAQELREILASLGLKRVEDLVGRTDLLQRSSTLKVNSKAASIDVEKLLCPFDGPNTKEIQQNHNLEHGFDLTNLYEVTKPYIAEGRRYTGSFTVNNEQRDVGVITGSEISKQYGEAGLPENTINVYTNGHAGQSLAAYAPKGLMIHHTGDANDYVGKGLSGGTVIVKAPFEERQNEIIAGNVSFYGATGGKAFINGSAGERFCIRNSGVDVVVEGIGDHGLEYMTGGHVINLGDVGKNFGQGMSGGIAYVIPSDVEAFVENNQLDTLSFTKIKHQEEKAFIKQMLEEHVSHTNSTRAIHVLKHFDRIEDVVVKVIPKDYQLMMQKIHLHKSLHDNEDEAMLAAFYDDSKTIDAKHKPAVVY